MGSVPAGRNKRADVTGGPQTFRSPTAVVIWWVWLLFAAANLIDLAVQGRDHFSLVAAAILVLATGVAYVTAQRPRVVADRPGLTIVNPLRDHHVGWANVTRVDLADLLRVHCQPEPGQGRGKIIYCWAVHYSRRRKLVAENRVRRQAARANSGLPSFGLGGYSGRREAGYASAPGAAPPASAEAEAERIARALTEYVTAAQAETVWANGTVQTAGASPPARSGSEAPRPGAAASEAAEPAGDAAAAGWLEPLISTWDGPALLALVIPALILLIVVLV